MEADHQASTVDCEQQLAQLFQTPELRTEMRAYLRQRLFTAVQNSALGPCLARKDVKPVSPKLQTLNLLIAEYLLKNCHHFTLSVFTCEAPAVSCIAPSLQETLSGVQTGTVPFKDEDLGDMLHTLGVVVGSAQHQKLLSWYHEQERPLLECLIRVLPEMCEQSSPVPQAQKKDQETSMASIQEIGRLQETIADLKSHHKAQLDAASRDWAIQLTAQEQLMEEQRAIHKREEEKLVGVIKTVKHQLATAEKEISEFKIELNQESHKRKIDDLAALEQKMKLKREKLNEEVRKLNMEKQESKKAKKKLKEQQKQLDDLALAQAHSQKLGAVTEDSTSPLKLQLESREREIEELRTNIFALKQENETLKRYSDDQRQKIENLNIRVAEMFGELTMARERLAFDPYYFSRSYQSRHVHKPRYSSSGEDSSPTDDIVKDAKRRIRSLEQELEVIKSHHKSVQERLLNDTVLSSVYGASSGQMFTSPGPKTPSSVPPVYSGEYHSNHKRSIHSNYPPPPPIPKLPKTHSPRRGPSLEKTPLSETKKTNNICYIETLPELNAAENLSGDQAKLPSPPLETANVEISKHNKEKISSEDSNEIIPLEIGDTMELNGAVGMHVSKEISVIDKIAHPSSTNGFGGELDNETEKHSNENQSPSPTERDLIVPVLKSVAQTPGKNIFSKLNDNLESSSSGSIKISGGVTSQKDDDDFWGL